MTTNSVGGSHLSKYLSDIRIKRGLKPGQLAQQLKANNISKVGGLIRNFELSGELNSYWLEKLIHALKPDPNELQTCIDLDIEEQKQKWEEWAKTSIDPYLTIRYIPAVYANRQIPKAFTSSRDDAEFWCSKELKSFRAKGYLNWTRTEQTFYKKDGTISSRHKATFETPPASAWIKVSGSSKKFIFKEELTSTVKVQTITEVRP